jgi:hypothetical protein
MALTRVIMDLARAIPMMAVTGEDKKNTEMRSNMRHCGGLTGSPGMRRKKSQDPQIPKQQHADPNNTNSESEKSHPNSEQK